MEQQLDSQVETATLPAGDGDPARALEAILFASAAPLSLGAMRERLPEGADIGGMLLELQKTYEGRGVQLIEMDGSWAFRTASDLSESLKITRDVQRKLSRAAMETLAIVAYHQPVTRAEIENIRGVATHKGTLDVLMECGWIKPGRRRETPGRPVTWMTTTDFLDHFGLESIMDLPGLDDLKASGLLDRRPAIDALATGSLFGDDEESDLADAESGEENEEDELRALEDEADADEEAARSNADEESEEESEEDFDEDDGDNDNDDDDDDDDDDNNNDDEGDE